MVPQVVGAGYSISERTGDLATIVKLLRVAMLVPMVFVIMLAFRHHHAAAGGPKVQFPFFLAAFIVLAAVNSLGLVPDFVSAAGGTISRWCLVIAIAAVGAKTALRDFAKVGWTPVALMLVETAVIGVFVLAIYLFAMR